MRTQFLAGFMGVALAFTSISVMGETAGAVSQLSGTLSVRKADGSVRILSQKSQIQPGDTVNTQRDSYAQIRFPDGSQVHPKRRVCC